MNWHERVGSASEISTKPMAKRPSQKLRNTLADLTKALEQIEAPGMVIGGIAVIVHGVARQTIVIDSERAVPRAGSPWTD
jgi:hypothetical protein